jgi:hypothetical protein
VRRIAKIIAALIIAAIALELISAGMLYQHYAHEQKSFVPRGSAAIKLLHMSWDKLRGRHPDLVVSSDHGPLFAVDEELGFTTLPGRYRVREVLENETHEFDLTVVAKGRRAASYQPVNASKRIFVLGDSFAFGWGLDDEQTLPWLLQTRLPDVEIVNMALNSYSAVQAMLLLQRATPALNSGDVVVVMYHALTNELSAMKQGVLVTLADGVEIQLGGVALKDAKMPFGALNSQGALEIRHVSIACGNFSTAPDCARPPFDVDTAARVTERAFDKIMAMPQGRLVIGWLSGPDTDPVIRYLSAHGAAIADLREKDGARCCEDEDTVPTDKHAGPFATAGIYQRLLGALQELHVVP